jgi:hypothetical protein
LLTFERNQLRLAHASGNLDSYLGRVDTFFKIFYENQGSFQVVDFDEFMVSTIYDAKFIDLGETQDSRSFLVRPALDAEEFQLNIPPKRWEFDTNLNFKYRFFGTRTWYRVIHCHAFASVAHSSISRADLDTEESSEIWKLLFRTNADGGIYELGLPASDLSEMFNLHIFCGRRRKSDNPYALGWKPFHIKWFRVGLTAAEDFTWKSGLLYDSKMNLQESAFTVGLFPQRMEVSSITSYYDRPNAFKNPETCYWTIILLTPQHMDKRKPFWDMKSPESAILDLIFTGLSDAADSWEEIGKLLSPMLGDQVTILNPEKHDGLLFDDNTFSRSRRYFWAVECLDVFLADIRDAVKQWEYFWRTWEEVLGRLQKGCRQNADSRHKNDEQGRPILDNRADPKFSEALDRIEKQIRRLRELEIQFDALLQKIQTLREAVSSLLELLWCLAG